MPKKKRVASDPNLQLLNDPLLHEWLPQLILNQSLQRQSDAARELRGASTQNARKTLYNDM